MALVENAGLFAPVDQATLDQVPAEYRPSTGAWTGIAARSTVFAYNPTLLTADQLPASLLDLQNADWKGRWAASPAAPTSRRSSVRCWHSRARRPPRRGWPA